ncbi:hypothetical protein B0H17DRAFT_1180606 [Mycena rosella]|uniref:C2H2-type domain-containing protein n=1 Tax=Mycena rosella TaxID=1033263 RepID=A0AAD7DD30_MYCRO|nr:hypothetical protein B0H17DRAFT_1180606 [Mycena rosella]
MASMKIEESPVSLAAATALVAQSPPIEELSFSPQFNSLYDLDTQYPSSRSLNAPSPESVTLDYLPYSPPTPFSASWSLDSIFTTALTSPADTLPSSSSDIRLLPASWSSSSKSSLSTSPMIVVKSESASFFLRTPDASLADINMFQASVRSQGSSGSIDPAYLTAPLSGFPSESLPSINRHGRMYDEDVFKSTGFGPNGFTRSLRGLTSPIKSEMDDEAHAPGPSRMMHPSALPEVVARPRILKRKSSTQDAAPKVKKEDAPSFIPGSPILNAHRGIDQGELEARASRYQQRNPGIHDFDRHWLASFCGKLSDQGEMMKDFRCYVVGCPQVNKRRDHMIVHIGAHLDRRPFKCEHCPATFLRKNELKRHESNHDTARPFGCSHCTSTFRRQDLLTRHLKSLHRNPADDDKENVRPRKKAKTL